MTYDTSRMNYLMALFRLPARSPRVAAYLIPAFALGGFLVSPQTASATTYSFTVPVGTQSNPNPNTILWAMQGAIINNGASGFNATPTSYAFYDFYLRPQITSDGCLVSTPADNCTGADTHGNNMAGGNNTGASGNTFTLIPDYSMANSTATPPVAPCTDPCTSSAYTATPNVTEPSKGGASIHFTFSPADNTIALITENPNAGGKSYSGTHDPFPAGMTTEIMPSTATFSFTLSTNTNYGDTTPQLTFEIYALAVEYTNINATTLGTKDLVMFSDLDLVGTAPEPSTIFGALGGIGILILAHLRRKANRKLSQ